MKLLPLKCLLLTLALAAMGCQADVGTTEDSTRVELEGPKIERGDAPVDLNPSTDDDIDVKTPTNE